ncbi:MAG TPA: GNAT family N-acetyltransferase [Acidimicrobiia bacterium]|nr:GNAT family N-acetyltransferase [Acidimicrobiia bacterium]
MPRHQLSFHPLTRDDFPLLAEWLSQPHVSRWWRHDPTPTAVEADFGPAVDGTDPTEVILALANDQPIGLMQSYRLGDHPTWLTALNVVNPHEDSVGIDYLIGDPAATGRGLGTAMIRQFVDMLWSEYPDAPAVVVAVNQDNIASWRTLEKGGFRRIWSGTLKSDDPSDQGDSHLYQKIRPAS